MTNAYLRLGEMLLERGLLTRRRLNAALRQQQSSGGRLGEILVSKRFLTQQTLTEILAAQYGYAVADLEVQTPEPEALAMLDGAEALRHGVLPLRLRSSELECALADPLDLPMTDALAQRANMPVRVFLAAPDQLNAAIRTAYGFGRSETKARRRMKIDAQEDRAALLAALHEPEPPSMTISRLFPRERRSA